MKQKAKQPEVSFKTYRLEVERDYTLIPGKKYWDPIGCNEGSLESVKEYLKSDFNLYREFPHIKYRVVEVTNWKPTSKVVEEGERK